MNIDEVEVYHTLSGLGRAAIVRRCLPGESRMRTQPGEYRSDWPKM
jgi:hypothetical protein